jgi:hypothetical protein
VSDKLVALEMDNMALMEQGKIDKALESIKQEISLIQGACREPHQLPVTIRNTFQVSNMCAGSVGLNVSGNVLHPSYRKRTRRGIHDG